MADTLTALSQRNEAFWIGLAIFILGVISLDAVRLGGVELSRALILIGGGILFTRLTVGVYRILTGGITAWKDGYRERIRDD